MTNKMHFSAQEIASVFNAFVPPANKVDKKVRAIEEKLKAMEGFNVIGLDAAEICLFHGVIIPAKFKVPDFEKYKGASDPRTHIRAYSDDDKLLMHFFQDILSGAYLYWYIQLKGTHIPYWRDMVKAFLKQYKYNTQEW